jgi:hypothetical protein
VVVAGTVFAQRKIGKTPGQRQAILRPCVGIDQRLRGLIQTERDL